MTKLLKISGRLIGILLEWILLLVIVFAFVIRTSTVQSFITKFATEYLSEELGVKVQIDNLHIVFIDRVALDGVFIEDQEKDTLLHLNRLNLTLDKIDFLRNKYVIGETTIEGGLIHLKRDNQGVFNYQFLKDYFSKPKKKKKKSVSLNLHNVALKDVHFIYDDNRKERRIKGVDYWHIDANSITANLSDIKFKNDVISAKLNGLSCVEKSGFTLNDLTTDVEISQKGVYLSALEIITAKSKINASKLNLKTTAYSNFLYFVDSVKFDAKIDSSSLALDEVALFGYVLEGMNDRVSLKTEVHRTVKKLKLKNFDLNFKEKTRIKGTINLDDYRDFKNGFFHEIIDYSYIDFTELQTLRLPNISPVKYISLDERTNRFGFIESIDTRLDGSFDQFVIAADKISTKIGVVQIDNGIMFHANPQNNSYLFNTSNLEDLDLTVDNFDIGAYTNNQDIGTVNGKFALEGEIFNSKDIRFYKMTGDIDKIEYLNYPYSNISIFDGSFEKGILKGKVDIQDDNLKLIYDGILDFNGEQRISFNVDLISAFLDRINLTTKNSFLRSNFNVDITGRNLNEYKGEVIVNGLIYKASGKEIKVPSMTLMINRSRTKDVLEIKSDIADVNIDGKIDFNQIMNDFKYQFSRIFPTLFTADIRKNKRINDDNFNYSINIKEADDFLSIFLPDLKIANNTLIKGKYVGSTSNLTLEAKSSMVEYKDYKMNQFEINQIIDSNSVAATYYVEKFKFNDSIFFDNVYFKSTGSGIDLLHELSWEKNTQTPSMINWHTKINDWNHSNFILDPSYFYIKNHRWDIAHTSSISVDHDTIMVDFFELTRGSQVVQIDGKVSNQPHHHLNFKIDEFDLNEISSFISPEHEMEGKLNGWGFISDPFNEIQYIGDASLIDFYIDKREVGDIFVQSEWNNEKKSLAARGDLIYKGNQTFNFDGDYYFDRISENLDFDLFFDYTDIQFTNAFMDPDVVSDIRGLLNGTIQLTGEFEKPKLEGEINLAGGSAYVDILGAHFGIDGLIEIDEYGFYINNIPVFDEEGNAGSLIGSIYHDYLTDFNFDLQFDLERDAINKDPITPWKVVPLEKFLVMNTPYSPENSYYGTGYVTGTANIFGYTDNLEINTDLKTKKGTWLNIPMYGAGEIETENNFILFKEDEIDSSISIAKPKIDFTGVDLNLNFEVTEDAELKIIFNDDLDDEIKARGNGNISIEVDNLGALKMDGVFTVKSGIYDFVMGPVKQKFFIEEGGTINWTGNPYDANLNLRTFYRVNANIADISQDQIGSGSGAHQQILCYLDLTESLIQPTINFDIQAPQANDIARSLISRVNNDPAELNRQFFSLLLWKKFQALTGSTSADGSAAIDLVTNQLNSLLSMVSSDYKLNVNFDSDKLTGDKQYEFGVSKGFLDDRLQLSGSFGVENQSIENQSSTNLIGDLNLEYLLNESGTFRVNIFNQSTDKTIIQSAKLDPFTQGAGIHYKEDYDNAKDFKLLQYFLDVFRKKGKKRYPIKRKKEQRPVPKDIPNSIIKPDESDIKEE